MNIYIDIDETICCRADCYENVQPIVENIQRANKLYDDGHQITYWTARGTKTGVDHYNLTKSQLDKWGVKYHELKMGKPAYDIIICDKSMHPRDWPSLDQLWKSYTEKAQNNSPKL